MKLKSLALAIIISSAGYAQSAESKGKTKKAVKIECFESAADGCVELGKSYLSQNKVEEAEKAFEQGCTWKVAQSCLKLGIVEEKLGKKERAKQWYKKACELTKDDKCINAKAMD